MTYASPVARLSFLVALSLLVAACASTNGPVAPIEPARPQYTSPILPDQLIGRWGLAAYHRPDDAARTETQARQGCSQPYVINRGAVGVMMYLADQPQPSDLVSKATPGGPTFIGPPDEPAGSENDREVVRFDGNVMVLRWVDKEVAGRYGVMVYVRCP